MQNIQQRIDSIRNDREHGSRWLVRETMMLLREMATAADVSKEEVRAAGKQLAQARPSMAAIAGAVWRILAAQDAVDAQEGKEGMAHKAEQMLTEFELSLERIITFARPLLKGVLMTDSISGTVVETLTACKQQIERVIVLEGRPRYEGRETARLLARSGVAVTLITDAQADIFMPQCAAVIVGADTVLANSDVFNKAGTALLGWAARGRAIPLYVLCETLKIAPYSWAGNLTQLEEKESREVLEQPIEGVTARNFYFDCTPARLVTGIVTERGILGEEEITRLAAQVREMIPSE